MKVILLGASGIIGSEIAKALSSNHEIVRAGRNGDVKVDYTDTQSVKAMFEQTGKFDALMPLLAVIVPSNLMKSLRTKILIMDSKENSWRKSI